MKRNCDGEGALFLSTDPVNHDLAAELCRTCPAIEWCMRETTAALHSIYGIGVFGTWAGVLYSEGRRVSGKVSVGYCPQCDALDGHPCRSPKGTPIGRPHWARTYGLPRCLTCGAEFKRTPSLIRYCSEDCAKTATLNRKRVWKNKHVLDKRCADCNTPTGGERCVRCNAKRASAISHGRVA